jgi:hypothetical protein
MAEPHPHRPPRARGPRPKVWTKRRGSGFKVDTSAKPVTAEARAEQGLGPKPRA